MLHTCEWCTTAGGIGQGIQAFKIYVDIPESIENSTKSTTDPGEAFSNQQDINNGIMNEGDRYDAQ